MTRSIDELNITNFVNTGLTTPLDRYTFDIELKWTDDSGVQHEHSANRTFPNALSAMPLAVRKEFAIQMLTAVVRVELGLDSWEDYQ
jgi:hypothetical protein